MRHLAGHEDFSRESEIKGSSNRSFGIVFSVVFTIVGIGPLLAGRGVRVWATVAAVAVLGITLGARGEADTEICISGAAQCRGDESGSGFAEEVN
jgi:hypothetical protein